MSSELEALRTEIADACRGHARSRPLADGVLGHVSVRIDETHMLIRCRGPQELGPGDGGLARMTLPSRRHVAVLTIPEADLVELPDLGSVVTVRTAWRHELARISREDD